MSVGGRELFGINTFLDPFGLLEGAERSALRERVQTAEHAVDSVPSLGTELSARARRSAAHKGTVLLVSGFGGSEIGLGPMLRSLDRDGFDARGVTIPDGGFAFVHQGVEELDRAIEQAPDGPIHLAGHSKGGVVVQAWYAQASAAQRARVESISLLASTHSGQTNVSKLKADTMRLWGGDWTRSALELQTGTDTMRALQGMRVPHSVRVLSVTSANDELLSADESAWSRAREVRLTGETAPSHMGMLASGDAYAQLRTNILAQS